MNIVAIVEMIGLAVLGLLVGWWLGRASVGAALAVSQQRAQDLESRNTQQEGEIQRLRVEQKSTEMEKTRSEEQLKAAQQSLADLTRVKEEMENTFKALAADGATAQSSWWVTTSPFITKDDFQR